MAILTLKAKYRDPQRRGPRGQVAKRRTGNSHPTPEVMNEGNGNRRIAGGPYWYLVWGSTKPIEYS